MTDKFTPETPNVFGGFSQMSVVDSDQANTAKNEWKKDPPMKRYQKILEAKDFDTEFESQEPSP